MRPALTETEIRALPAVVSLTTAARAFGFGRTFAYDLASRDEFPVPVHRYGRVYRVRTTDVIKALGLDQHPTPPTPPAPAPAYKNGRAPRSGTP